MKKIIKIILIVFSVLAALFLVFLPNKNTPANEAVNSSNLNLMFIIAYILLTIAVVTVLIYSVKNVVSSPEKLKKSLLLIGGFLVIIALGYFLSGSEAVKGSSAATSKWVGAGLISFYILTIIAIGATVFSGIKKFLIR